MTNGRVHAALTAQVLGQATTAWALAAHFTRWPDVSLWVVAFLAVAALVPFRHDGSLRDRAAGNFGAAVAVAGFLGWDVLLSGVDSIFGGGRLSPGTEIMLTLTSSVLFSIAGALFWTLREGGGEP